MIGCCAWRARSQTSRDASCSRRATSTRRSPTGSTAGSGSRRDRLLGADRGVIDCCTSCLRRAFLLAHLAPRIAGLLGRRERRATGLLALPEDDLLAAAAGEGVEEALAFLDGVDAEAERERLGARGFSVLCSHARAYPPLLRELADPPAVLFAAGREETFA